MPWSLLSGTALHWRRWGEETVVYNAASGDTHLLGVPEAVVLGRLEAQACNVPELVGHLAQALGLDADDDELYFYVDDLLTRLEGLALVERSTP